MDELIKLYMELVSFYTASLLVSRTFISLVFVLIQIVLFTDHTLWKFTEKAGELVATLCMCVNM